MGFSVAGSSVPALSITDSSITGSSIAASSAAEPGISARDNIQRQQHSASASSENVASAPVGINLHE